VAARRGRVRERDATAARRRGDVGAVGVEQCDDLETTMTTMRVRYRSLNHDA